MERLLMKLSLNLRDFKSSKRKNIFMVSLEGWSNSNIVVPTKDMKLYE